MRKETTNKLTHASQLRYHEKVIRIEKRKHFKLVFTKLLAGNDRPNNGGIQRLGGECHPIFCMLEEPLESTLVTK